MPVYRVEQGMPNPREKSIDYRFWSEHTDEASAFKVAKELKTARVLKCVLVREYFDGKVVKV